MKVLRTPIWAMAAVLAGMSMDTAFAAADGGPTFDQVMQAPDDQDLNLAYAKAQASGGHLLSAAAALERVLMARPNAASVRLLYAVVLYRLDDLQGASAQLAMVDETQLPALERAELAKYRRVVDNGRKDSKITGQLAAGFSYNSDARGALLAQFDKSFGGSPAEEGTGAVFAGVLNGSTKLGTSEDFTLYGSLAGYSRNDLSGPNDKLQYLAGELGVKQTEQMASWQVGAVAGHYWLFGSPYLTEYGGRAQANWRMDTATTLSTSFEAVWQDYDDPLIDSIKSFLGGTDDGGRYNLKAGIDYRVDSYSKIGVAAGYEMHTAGYKPFGYDAPFVGANYHGLLGSGVYLDLQGDLRWIDFRAVDGFFLPTLKKKRRDTSDSIRAALGVPLSAFSPEGATADGLENLTLEGALSYSTRGRPLPLADYDGFGAEFRLVWHFGSDR